jgi:hypothetical protein
MTEIQTCTDAIRAALSAGNKKMNISILSLRVAADAKQNRPLFQAAYGIAARVNSACRVLSLCSG